VCGVLFGLTVEISESLYNRAITSLWFVEHDGHWISTLHKHHGEVYRLRDNGRRVSQLLVLWCFFLGDPFGQLTNACGNAECVNPFHYKDGRDRQQYEWARDTWSVDVIAELTNAGYSTDDVGEFGLKIFDICELSPSDILDKYGMTIDFGCYHCGTRFDPFESRNKVLCNDCWSEEDQREMEKRDAA
jgi:hypothetical protein